MRHLRSGLDGLDLLICVEYSVLKSASTEAKIICQLVNQGLDPRRLFIAAITLYSDALIRKNRDASSFVVESGLFQGMKLEPEALGSVLPPKIQGTYEKEVQDYLQLCADQFDRFLDVGCAEGFYLSGIARWKKIPCLGVDIDQRAGDAVRHMATANGVSDLVSFEYDLSLASSFINGSLLCLVDVDGDEVDVLNSLMHLFANASALEDVILIVESDFAGRKEQNSPEIISLLTGNGWLIASCLHQQPSCRFVHEKADMSFLDQVVWGSEGRSAGQSWVVAKKRFGLIDAF